MKTNVSQLEESLRKLQNLGFTIGFHQVAGKSENDTIQTAEKILHGELRNIRDAYADTLDLNVGNNLETAISNYHYTVAEFNDPIIVCAIPNTMSYNGNEFYLGVPSQKIIFGNKREKTSIVELITRGQVPNEFILGYYIRGENGNLEFVGNPNHCYFTKNKEMSEEMVKGLRISKSKSEFAGINRAFGLALIYNDFKNNKEYYDKVNEEIKKVKAALPDMDDFLKKDAVVILNTLTHISTLNPNINRGNSTKNN